MEFHPTEMLLAVGATGIGLRFAKPSLLAAHVDLRGFVRGMLTTCGHFIVICR
jgi:hypothetical protein